MARLRGRQAVYLVTVPPDWKPQRLWDWPPTFTDGQLVAKNLPPASALGYCRTYNKNRVEAQQQGGEPIGTWALYVRHLKPNWQGQPNGEQLDKAETVVDLQEGEAVQVGDSILVVKSVAPDRVIFDVDGPASVRKKGGPEAC